MLTRLLRPGESDSVRGADWSYAPPAGGITNSTANVAMKAAVAGKRNYVTSVQMSIGVVLATASEVVIKSGSTVLHRISMPVTAGVQPPIKFDPPLVGGVNEAINVAAVTQFATGNLVVNAQGYTV